MDIFKIGFGLMLGEMCRSHRKNKIPTLPVEDILGLVCGYEPIIDKYLNGRWISNSAVDFVKILLQRYEDNPDRQLKSFDDIKEELQQHEIGEDMARPIFAIFRAKGWFPDLFRKLEESGMDLKIDLDSRYK